MNNRHRTIARYQKRHFDPFIMIPVDIDSKGNTEADFNIGLPNLLLYEGRIKPKTALKAIIDLIGDYSHDRTIKKNKYCYIEELHEEEFVKICSR